jgi:hypothetical protein
MEMTLNAYQRLDSMLERDSDGSGVNPDDRKESLICGDITKLNPES